MIDRPLDDTRHDFEKMWHFLQQDYAHKEVHEYQIEALAVLEGQGFHKAYITGYSDEANGLYEKLGSCKRKQWFHYELERK